MQYILVTGAAGGMGQKAVACFRQSGFCVFALDSKVGAEEEGVIWLKADVTDAKSVQQAFETVQSYTPKLYAIVHFVGVYLLDSLIEIDAQRFSDAFRINLFGAYQINKIFLPLLQQNGRILITTSELATLDPLPFTGLYAVTKSALDKYAYSLCMELQLLGIHVSVLRAGAVQTGMLGVSTDALDDFCKRTALYSYNGARFRRIVERVETKSVLPETIARKAMHILRAKHPHFAYSVNRNPLLLLLNLLPKRLQLYIVRCILKGETSCSR